MSKNNSIDKMAAQFNSIEEMQAYADAQYKTIQTLNGKINDLSKQLDVSNGEVARLKVESAQGSVKADLGKFAVSDEEAICVMQLALLKRHSDERELITDEVKRVEVLVKALQVIRGKDVTPKSPAEKSAAGSKSDELFKQLEELNKSEPQ